MQPVTDPHILAQLNNFNPQQDLDYNVMGAGEFDKLTLEQKEDIIANQKAMEKNTPGYNPNPQRSESQYAVKNTDTDLNKSFNPHRDLDYNIMGSQEFNQLTPQQQQQVIGNQQSLQQ